MNTKKSTPVLAVIWSLLISAVLIVSASAAPDPLKGSWHSTDVDDSYQTLHIGGGPGNAYHVKYRDNGATVCGLDPDTGEILYAATANGFLELSSGALSGSLPLYCLAGPRYLYNAAQPFAFTYQAGTDTLLDGFGNTWSR